MDTRTVTLTDFLLARIGEDEAAARACAGAPWVDSVPGMIHVDPAAIREAKWQFGKMGYVATVEHAHDGAHIARHDPARVLADCEAKRQIAYQYEFADRAAGHDPAYQLAAAALRTVVSHLALPFADHPDYDEAWRP